MDMLINKPGGRANVADVSTGGRGGGRNRTRGGRGRGKGSGKGNAGRGGKTGKRKQGDVYLLPEDFAKLTKEQKSALFKKRIADKKVSAVGKDATVAAVMTVVEPEASHPTPGVPVVASAVGRTNSEEQKEVVKARYSHYVHPSRWQVFERTLQQGPPLRPLKHAPTDQPKLSLLEIHKS
jgi:hypothetical protein